MLKALICAATVALLSSGAVGGAQTSLARTAPKPAHSVPAYALPGPEKVFVGASSPEALAKLVLEKFASATPAAFDSVYPDPFGRMVVAGVRGKTVRDPGEGRVLWSGPDHAVLLLTGTLRSGTSTGIGAGGDETNRVRRFSGLYEATRSGDTWMLTRQIPLDSANYIRAQTLHVALTPGERTHIIDSLAITVGAPYGFAARINNAAEIADLRVDGRTVEHSLSGGVLWIKAPVRAHSELVMKYSIAADRDTAEKTKTDTIPTYAALNNTDAWHPFFNYDSGNDFGPLAVTATIAADYQLTTTVPQTETVANGVRTVHGTSMHPQFLLALIYDKNWEPETTKIGDLRFQTFLTPDYHFQHDTLASIAGRVYKVLVPRFGEPQLPSHYLTVVEERALGHSGFAVRMNNAVISGDRPTSMDESVLGPSYSFAHEISHGWTMNATGLAANFLQEGWATYAESLMLRDVYGPASEHAFWEKVRTSYATGLDRAGFLGGFDGKQSILGDPDNGRIHYFKGSWILHSLNYLLGDAKFDAGMREYISRSGKGPDGYQEFIAAMSHAAGHDMTSFIMPWLSEKYIPNVDAHVEGSNLIVAQSQPSAPFDLPMLDIALTTASGIVHKSVHLHTAPDTVNLGGIGTVTEIHVDPDHHFLLRRHWGDVVRFELRAPNAKTVELTGNFAAKPIAATRNGDVWTVEMPMTEGRYIWLWRVDGKSPSDEVAIASAKAAVTDGSAVAGVLVVKPVKRLDDADAR